MSKIHTHEYDWYMDLSGIYNIFTTWLQDEMQNSPTNEHRSRLFNRFTREHLAERPRDRRKMRGCGLIVPVAIRGPSTLSTNS